MFLIKNKDDEKMMDDFNRTVYPFTSRYKKRCKGQSFDTGDWVLFEELRQKLSVVLIDRLNCDAKIARAIAKKWVNKSEYDLFKETHTFAGSQSEYALWNFYDDCVRRISDIERILSWDEECILDGIEWLGRWLDWFDLGYFRALSSSEGRENVLLYLAQ